MTPNVRTAAVRVDGLSRRYGTIRALDEVDLTLQRGITGLLGPNGAGKTTLLSILASINEPDAGRVSVFGFDPHDRAERVEIRRRLGYLPQELGYHRHFTVAGFLDYVAILKEITDRRRRAQEVARVLAALGLERRARTRIRALSGGMRQRLGIAQALLGDPELLILDEPTAGLDPEQRLRFRELLSGLPGDPVIVLSIHLAGGLVIWLFIRPTEPLWWRADWEIGGGQLVLGLAVLVAAQLAAGRPRRDAMADLYASFPHPLAGVLGALALFITSASTHLASGEGIWLLPWAFQGQLGALPGPLAGYPPAGARGGTGRHRRPRRDPDRGGDLFRRGRATTAHPHRRMGGPHPAHQREPAMRGTRSGAGADRDLAGHPRHPPSGRRTHRWPGRPGDRSWLPRGGGPQHHGRDLELSRRGCRHHAIRAATHRRRVPAGQGHDRPARTEGQPGPDERLGHLAE